MVRPRQLVAAFAIPITVCLVFSVASILHAQVSENVDEGPSLVEGLRAVDRGEYGKAIDELERYVEQIELLENIATDGEIAQQFKQDRLDALLHAMRLLEKVLRNPKYQLRQQDMGRWLSAVSGLQQFLAKKEQADEERAKTVEAVVEGAGRMVGRVDQKQLREDLGGKKTVALFYLGVARFKAEYLSLRTAGIERAADYGPAKKALEQALALAPARGQTRMYLGRLYEQEDDFSRAADLYRGELSLRGRKEDIAPRLGLARIDYHTGDYSAAIKALEEIILRAPRCVEARYYLGLSYIELKQYQDAIKTLENGLGTLKSWRDEIFHLIRRHYRAVAPDEPRRPSEILRNWDELRKEIWELRKARSRPEKKGLEAIIDKYKWAQKFAIDLHLWPELHKALGDAHLGRKQWSAARNSYRDAMETREGDGTEQDPEAWARIGAAYFAQGKQLFEQQGLLFSAIRYFYAAEGDKLPTPAMLRTQERYTQGGRRGTRGRQQRTTGGGGQGQQQIKIDPEDQLDGYARALYCLGMQKPKCKTPRYEATTPVEEMSAPTTPDPVAANVLDGLGQVYLYEAKTYPTDEPRNIESHTFEEAIKAFDIALLYKSDFVPSGEKGKEFDEALLEKTDYVPALLHKAQALLELAEQSSTSKERLNYLKGNAGQEGVPEEEQDEYIGVGAEQILTRAKELAEDSEMLAALHAEQARVQLALDNYDRAEKAARAALDIDQKNVVALNSLGLVRYYQGEYVKARDHFLKAIEIDDDDYQAFVNLGNSLYALQSWGRAHSEYLRALERLPESTIANTSSERPYVIYLIGRTLQQRGEYDRAIEIAESALSMRTDFYAAHELLGRAYAGRKEWRAAEEAFKSALANAPIGDELTQSRIHYELGQIYERQGDTQQAAMQYEVALAEFSGNAGAREALDRLRASAQ